MWWWLFTRGASGPGRAFMVSTVRGYTWERVPAGSYCNGKWRFEWKMMGKTHIKQREEESKRQAAATTSEKTQTMEASCVAFISVPHPPGTFLKVKTTPELNYAFCFPAESATPSTWTQISRRPRRWFLQWKNTVSPKVPGLLWNFVFLGHKWSFLKCFAAYAFCLF